MGNSNIKIISAALIGATVGGILGILLAPKKGSKTRKIIGEKTDDLGDMIKEKLHHVLSDVKKEIEGAKEKASQYVGENKSK